jgi:hypothetical protein
MDGSSRAHGERTMNTKRLAALLALGALLATAAPAMAVTQTGAVTVEWNYAITATLTMFTQTTASKTHNATPTAGVIYWAGNGSTSSGCNGTTNTANTGADASANLTVNFGNVVADATDYTNCLETNAVDAYYVTNDSKGADFSVQVTAGTAAGQENDYDTATNGSLLCMLGNGFAPSTTVTGGPTTWTASARAAAVAMSSTTACSSGEAITTTNQNFYQETASAAAGNDLNTDIQLNMGPSMQSGQATLTVTYTMTTN